jgi:hypothetical protein
MSFILDALKKSETERQQQTGAEFSSVPSSSGEPQSLSNRHPSNRRLSNSASRRSNSVLRRQSRISLRRSYPQPIRRRSGSSRPR